jgi:hypothetical protein
MNNEVPTIVHNGENLWMLSLMARREMRRVGVPASTVRHFTEELMNETDVEKIGQIIKKYVKVVPASDL